MSELEEEGPSSNKKATIEKTNAPQPIIQPTPQVNPWQYLQTGATNANGNIVNGVLTLDNGLKITAPPTGGFPSPQLGQSVWRNIALSLQERWPQKEGPKAWACIFRAKYEDNAQMTNIKMLNLIALIIGEAAASLGYCTGRGRGLGLRYLHPYPYPASGFCIEVKM
ncbi:hypothetical protein F4604DRAFT_1683499 [Suillus subluteus]|nr:hypothetical protein F4604DRAFT_1683499 [Suillus subluteus]